jgi:hypothetical protein
MDRFARCPVWSPRVRLGVCLAAVAVDRVLVTRFADREAGDCPDSP